MRSAAIAIVCCVGLAGCAVWKPLEPIRTPEQLTEAEYYGKLPSAINAANGQIDRYRDAITDHTYLRNTTTLVLLPLTAFTLYRGLTSAAEYQHNLLALGAGGAMIYQGGNMFFSNARQRSYYEGWRAISCAISASRPYLITQTSYQHLQTGRNDIVTSQAQVEAAITSVLRLQTDLALDPEWLKRIKSDVRKARGTITRADTTVALTEQRLEQAALAGPNLTAQVDSINMRVAGELVKSEPDFTALGKLGEGITKSMASFAVPERKETGTTADLPPEGKGSQEGDNGKIRQKRADARARIEAELAVLAAATSKLASDVNQQNERLKPLAEMSQLSADQVRLCDPNVTQLALDVLPAASTMTLSKDVPMRSLFIRNGAISWPPAGTGVDYLELQAAGNNQYIIQLKGLKPPAENADARITIVGNNGEQRFIDVSLLAPAEAPPAEVEKAAAAPAVPAPAPAPAGRSAAAKPALDKAVVNCVQQAIKMPEAQQDGLEGPTTSQAIAVFAKAHGLPEDIGLTPPLLQKLGCDPKG
jgi:hypothetical protein